MLSNVEINEQRRANATQLKTESTDEAVVELVVIGIDFQPQTRQAIIAMLERVRHVTFRKWIEDPMAPVDLNDPTSAMTPSFDTTLEYRATHVDLVGYSDVIEHLLGITRHLHRSKLNSRLWSARPTPTASSAGSRWNARWLH